MLAVLGLGEWWLVLCFWKLEHIAVSACAFLLLVFIVIDSLCIRVHMTEQTAFADALLIIVVVVMVVQ